MFFYCSKGPDPSLAYRPNLETGKAKDKEDYRNFEVIQKHTLNSTLIYELREKIEVIITGRHNWI